MRCGKRKRWMRWEENKSRTARIQRIEGEEGIVLLFYFLLYNFVINCLVTWIFRVFGKKYIPIITVSKIKPKKGTIN